MEVSEAISRRRSVRKYRHREMPREDIMKLLEAARSAPSGANRQPWEMVVITDPLRLKELVPLCKNQGFLADCALFIVGLDDVEAKWAKVDLAIALDHVTLRAEEMGLGTCWIGAFDPEALAKFVSAPNGRSVTVCLAVGYPDEEPNPRPRKPMDQLVSWGTYGKRQ
jgi:nitroreductase